MTHVPPDPYAPPPDDQPQWSEHHWGPPTWSQPAYAPPAGAPAGPAAIGAFVTSFLCFPVAVVLGIVALVQVRNGRYGGRGLAIAALAISGVWILAVILLAVAGANGAFHDTRYLRDATATAVGECADTDVLTPRVVPCTRRHNEEVFWVATLTEGGYPGDSTLDLAADAACNPHYPEYVGSPYDRNSDIGYDWYAPSRSEWEAGDRRVVCVITTFSAIGSARGSGG